MRRAIFFFKVAETHTFQSCNGKYVKSRAIVLRPPFQVING